MTVTEAAKVLGVTPTKIREWQANGTMPKPIPDDYLDQVIEFRVRLERAMRAKVDRERATNAGD